jgi:hypothetical protein
VSHGLGQPTPGELNATSLKDVWTGNHKFFFSFPIPAATTGETMATGVDHSKEH